MSKSVRDLAVKLENIEKKLLGNTSDREQLLTKIDEGIARLNETAGKINQVETKHATSREVPPAVSQAHDLKAIIRQAYKDLCEEVEYEDGSVPLPRLYYQARSVLPGLTVEALHRELLTLWQSQMLDLSVANEVRGIIEPDKAIKIDDNTYYFVKWRNK
ncbi:MAG: hypothetical protein K8T89_23250 [Planctomycetes bacterium]|nr:hypothetical protein [Planctomycetota bacterium]